MSVSMFCFALLLSPRVALKVASLDFHPGFLFQMLAVGLLF